MEIQVLPLRWVTEGKGGHGFGFVNLADFLLSATSPFR